MMVQTDDRVQAHTAEHINSALQRKARSRVMYAAGRGEAAISRQIDELDGEWDIERWLETNASVLAFTGTLLGLFVNRKFFAIPCLVLPFLFQHAVQGWCPPVPILRRKGVRTRREIDTEKVALKALRGDFENVRGVDGDSTGRAQRAWEAANA